MKQVILNNGGAWAFQELTEKLAKTLQIEISDVPGDFNYVLSWDKANIEVIASKMFIP